MFFKIFLILTIGIFLICNSYSEAQWLSDQRLTTSIGNSQTPFNNSKCVAASGNNVYAVWTDQRNGNFEVFYKRSIDGGISWSADQLLTNIPLNSEYPSIAVSGSVVHIVWLDYRGTNYSIYYKRSADNGTSWGQDILLSGNSGSLLYRPSVAVSGSNVHVVWEDVREGNWEIFYKRSGNGGLSWGADIRLTNDPAYSEFASVSASGSIVHVVWTDGRSGFPNNEIYYKGSADGGQTWGADMRLANSISARYPSVSSDSSKVQVVWEDERDGNFEIYTTQSIDGGINWSADKRITNNSETQRNASVTVSGSDVHVVWDDGRDGNNVMIYYKHSADDGLTWGADTRLTDLTGSALYPSIAVSGTVLHVVFTDWRDGDQEIYYKRNPTGNPVGIQNSSSEIPDQFYISQNYPNPFNPTTNLGFGISDLGFVSLKIYDIQGKEVAVLVNENLSPGSYEYEWNASGFPSGVYFYKLQAGDYSEVKKMSLTK